ncbi:hypothetical protein Pmani_033751 [Petrolisthes manimaculis]|uniref:Uncharacterized protein n=1 Tax=Petrolisthes manimaculis TaxID=1843537 RepID=A0AAE1NQM7_9EUCA|nr:hypothetical protein Pmani_033751 [Petrolisthes manimaculis]
MVNGYVFVNCRVCFELLDFIVCKTSSRHRHKCCQRHLQGSREFLKPWQASPDGIRHFSTVRHRSEELGRKLAEENRKRREQFEAREREREAEVDRSLLRPEDLEVYEAHKAAVARGHFTYDDPYTGYRVMTRLRHYWRGSCCGNACRHCIYEHDNVAQREKAQRVFNSAFWVDAKDRPDLRQKTRTKTLRGGRAEGSSSPPSLHHTTDDEIDDDIDPLLFKH